MDDLLITRVMDRKRGDYARKFEGPDADLCRAAEEAYSAAGLEIAVHKSFRGQANFKAWGGEVGGHVGTIGDLLSPGSNLGA